jgi:hypothetical protein
LLPISRIQPQYMPFKATCITIQHSCWINYRRRHEHLRNRRPLLLYALCSILCNPTAGSYSEIHLVASFYFAEYLFAMHRTNAAACANHPPAYTKKNSGNPPNTQRSRQKNHHHLRQTTILSLSPAPVVRVLVCL